MKTTIFKSVVSNGLKGEKLKRRLESKGFRVSSYAEELIRHKDFKTTSGTTYDLVLITGADIGKDSWTTQDMRDFAASKGCLTPPAEVASLLRESITDEEIEKLELLYLIIAHEPITDSGGRPGLLRACRDDVGRWLNACWGHPGSQWGRGGGWLFLAPQDTQAFISEPGPLSLSALNSRLEKIEEALEAIKKLL